MTTVRDTTAPVRHADRFFIGGAWVAPSSDATIDVIDSGTEELYYRVAAAGPDDMSRAIGAARRAFDEGPWPRSTHAERAEVLRAFAAGIQERSDVLGQLWPRESGTLYKNAQYAGRIGSGALASVRRARRHVPLGGGVPADGRRRVRPARARAGRGRRRDHPVERAGGADLPQDRAGAPRRVHGRAQVVARGAGRGLRVRRGRRGDRAAARRAQRRHRRPRGVGAARARPGRRQDHLHRIDRRRAAHRVVVRRAHRAVHARARREVGGGDPRRHRPRHGGQDARPRRVRAQRAGVLVADTDRRDEGSPRRARRGAGRRGSRRRGSAIRSTSRRSWARSSPNGSATASRATSPRASTRVRRSRPVADAPRTSTAATTWSRRSSATSTTARRSVAKRSSGPVLSVIAADDERDAVRIANDTIYGLNASVFTNDVDRARDGRAASSGPAPSGTTRSAPTSGWRSAASSSRASAAKAARRDCCRSSRPRR